MAIELVTGYAGSGHISAADVAGFQRGMVQGNVVLLETKEKMIPRWADTGVVRIYSGDIVCEGRHIAIETGSYVDVTLPSYSASVHYVICAKYNRVVSSGVESVSLAVLTGTSAGDPTIPSGSIEAGDAEVYFPLYSIYNNKYKPLYTLNSDVDRLRGMVDIRNVDFSFYERDVPAGGKVVLHCDSAILHDEIYTPIGVYPIISAALQSSGCVVSWNVVNHSPEYVTDIMDWYNYIDITIYNPTSSSIHLTSDMLKGRFRLTNLEIYRYYDGEDGQGYKPLR